MVPRFCDLYLDLVGPIDGNVFGNCHSSNTVIFSILDWLR